MNHRVVPSPRPLAALTLVAAMAAVLLLVAKDGSAGEAEPDPPRTQADCDRSLNRLSFVSRRAGLEQIYTLDIRRPAKVRRITRLQGFVVDPTWSPDGSRLAFRWMRPKQGTVGVYVARADGSRVRRLVKEAGTPAWSPDGREIAFANLRPGKKGISIVDVAAKLRGERGAVRVLTRTRDVVPEEYPAWSPDGERITFTSHRPGNSDIYVVDADGGRPRNLTSDPALDSDGTFSADSSQIVFTSARDAKSQVGGDIYVMNADGSDVRRLTTARRGSFGPAWSPDNRWIAFNSQRDGNSEVYVMRPDGSEQRRLTRHGRPDGFVAWVGWCGNRQAGSGVPAA